MKEGAVEPKTDRSEAHRKLAHFHLHIGMFVSDATYDTIAAFIGGFDYAHEPRLLTGFEEWLRWKYDVYSEFAWPSLVLHIHAVQASAKTDSVGFLVRNVLEFLAASDSVQESGPDAEQVR